MATGYLYHQQEPEPRTRRDTQKVRSSHPKPAQHNVARDAMLANMKTMAIVVGCMIVLLMLALYIARETWDIKNTSMVSQEMLPTLQRDRDPVRPDELVQNREVNEEAPKRTLRRQLNIDTMRKAVRMSNRAESLAKAGAYEEAIRRYREALEIWPYLTEGWAQIGRIYLQTKDYPKAQIALERAVENDPGSPQILNDLGVSHLFQNHVTKAMDIFDAVSEIDPGYAPSYFNIALCKLARQAPSEAAEMLNQYLRLRPDDPRALKELAFLYANERNYSEAMNSLRTALTHAPEWPPLYFDAAATAALMGHIEESIRYLDKAEFLTTPGMVYRAFQQPAFKDVRLSELGQIFEKEIAERARERIQNSSGETSVFEEMVTEPLSSTEPTI